MEEKVQEDKHIVIVGASHGGVAAAEQLRKQGFGGHISLLDRQKGMPVERPPLSKAGLAEGNSDGVLLRQEAWYDDHAITFRPNTEAISGDSAAQTLALASGEVLSWDALILATGAEPRILSAEGTTPLALHTLRVAADAEQLNMAMEKSQRFVVVGGGYIGLEVAASARKRGLDVIVIEMAPRLLARVASPLTSQFFHELHQKNGVDIRVETAINHINITETGVHFELGEGETLSADIALAGIGVLPDTRLGESLGLSVDNGFVVDASYRTEIKGIWAIGDVARAMGGYTDGRMRIESVHHAQMSAEIAVADIMGVMPKPHEVPWFWSDQYDVKLQSAGLVPQDPEVVERAGRREGAISFWSFAEGRLQAVEALNDGQAYMLGKMALEGGKAVTPSEIADPDFDLKTLKII